MRGSRPLKVPAPADRAARGGREHGREPAGTVALAARLNWLGYRVVRWACPLDLRCCLGTFAMASSLGMLMLALCSSVEAFAPAHMARSAVAVRAAPVRTAPVMQFGKKKLSPEEVSLAGPKRVGLRSWHPPCP